MNAVETEARRVWKRVEVIHLSDTRKKLAFGDERLEFQTIVNLQWPSRHPISETDLADWRERMMDAGWFMVIKAAKSKAA